MTTSIQTKSIGPDEAQELLIQKSRSGYNYVQIIFTVLLDYEKCNSVESFLASYTDKKYIEIAELVLALKGIE